MSSDKLDSFFGEGTSLKGTLKFKGQLRFDGDFNGEIHSGDSLIIGETGKVKANIKSGSLFNFGKIEGDVQAIYKIHMYPKSGLKGNIESPIIVMEEASHFEGACKMPPIPKSMPKTPAPVIQKEPPPAEEVVIPKPAPAVAAGQKKSGSWF